MQIHLVASEVRQTLAADPSLDIRFGIAGGWEMQMSSFQLFQYCRCAPGRVLVTQKEVAILLIRYHALGCSLYRHG